MDSRNRTSQEPPRPTGYPTWPRLSRELSIRTRRLDSVVRAPLCRSSGPLVDLVEFEAEHALAPVGSRVPSTYAIMAISPDTSRKQGIAVATVALCILLTSQRDLFKFGGWFVALSYAAILVAVVALLSRLHGRYERLAPAMFFMGSLATVSLVYPLADGLRAEMRGSDQDDAILICGRALLEGTYPYGQETYLGNPPSPGPGVLALFLPSLLAGWYPLTTVLGLALALAWIRKRLGPAVLVSFCLILATSLLYWDLLAVGSDLVVISLLITVATDWSSTVSTRRGACALGILAGVLGGSRTPLVFIPLIFAFPVSGRRASLGALIAIVGLGTALGLHAVLWVWDPSGYTPLHLIGKGDSILGVGGIIATVSTCTLAGAWLLVNRTRANIHLWSTVLGLGCPLGAVSLASLSGVTVDGLASWEGANYLFPVLPTLALWAALELARNGEAQRPTSPAPAKRTGAAVPESSIAAASNSAPQATGSSRGRQHDWGTEADQRGPRSG